MADPRVVFMGTPHFALPVLQAVLEMGWGVPGVYTAPDQPAGRGRRVEPPPVKRYAEAHGLPVYQPVTFRGDGPVEELRALGPDVVLVAAYGKLLPPAVLATARRGCVNVHPSLLPRYRGAAPVAATILAGDAVTGVTLIQMDADMDTGPILAQREEPVRPDDTTPALTERLFGVAATLVRETLPAYLEGTLQPRSQPAEGATTTRLLKKQDGELQWAADVAALERQVRAYQPWPGSATRWQGKRLEVLEAAVVLGSRNEAPGTVVALPEGPGGAGVVAARGVLALRRVKLEGHSAMDIAEFLRGHAGFVGDRLPS